MLVEGVSILKEVSNDLNEGKAFYDKKEPGVGDYFWDSLLADIESLLLYAGIHKKEHGFYRMFAKRFPYAIYYYIEEDVAYIVTILPVRRNPAWIKSKIKDRS